MARELIPMPPSEVRKNWNVIRPMIDRVREKTSERWLPEDVFAEIQRGAAHLYAGDVPDGEKQLQSIVIFKKYQEYGEDILRIWIACNLDRSSRIMDFSDSVRRIARGAGCKRIVWDSPRIGYKQVLPDIKLKSYRFEMEV